MTRAAIKSTTEALLPPLFVVQEEGEGRKEVWMAILCPPARNEG